MGFEHVPPVETFVRDLRRALYHLYDPDELRRNPVFALFSPEHGGSPSALRDLLVAAIATLKPAAGVSADSNAWRTHRLLQHRFVEQFDQAQVATNLGLSIRQIRRQEHQALQTLADVLWRTYDLAARSAPRGASPDPSGSGPAEPADRPGIGYSTAIPAGARTDSDPIGPDASGTSHAQELSWLGRSLPLEAVDVEQLVMTALETAGPLLQTLRVQLTCNLPPGLPGVEVQAGPVRQALLVLVSEAIRSAAGGRLVVAGQLEPAQVTISVMATSGTRMAADDIAATRERLTLAQRLAALSGGSLEILPESDGIPFGAYLGLPRVAPLSVLFIDDNDDVHQLFHRYLAGTRYAYMGERDPARALIVAETVAPQIIVLDVMLPGVDGWELLGSLRAHPTTRDIPVIICSILPLDELALSLGAADMLQKPVTREALLRALDRRAEALVTGWR